MMRQIGHQHFGDTGDIYFTTKDISVSSTRSCVFPQDAHHFAFACLAWEPAWAAVEPHAEGHGSRPAALQRSP